MTRCGVLLPSFDPFRTGEPRQIAGAARLAEDLGFDGVWVGDHLACPAPGLDATTCLGGGGEGGEGRGHRTGHARFQRDAGRPP
jgi:hypothetical protein